MSEIKIKTLTSLHIGSGETLHQGNDFVEGKQQIGGKEERILGIVDARKVMRLIGEENVEKWVQAIERGDRTGDIINVYAKEATVEDYTHRQLLLLSDLKPTDTLKEQMHDGLGRPYIPGSSIKGAIRTAVLASLATHNTDYQNMLTNNGGKPSAKRVEADLFGRDPNKDVFRFLQVGDAYFGESYEVALRMVNLNERHKKSFWDTTKSQLIEAIGCDDESSFRLKLNMSHYEAAQGYVKNIPGCMESLPSLFETINTHTQSLINKEIEFWEEKEESDSSGYVLDYIDRMKEMLAETQACRNGESCVLRIGHGSGWRFITGGWTEEYDNFKSVVVPASRPNYWKYDEYSFPKTRRVDDACELLGFVRLEIINNK
ncbi:type III-A CRISPR-associated RAMP protein Csm5 [Parabacteroides sp. OttesenSCG-928-N08]|nr:type III-A CRISPR-associated RAMP protein Csm5 [Parabacteroides sp. OttesenSCG-928-N08]